MERIPENELERIKREVPVESLCRRYGIELKPCGKDLQACCPWHSDDTPSFKVTPKKNLWNCLGGCGGGDNIQLVMRCEKVSFLRAVTILRELMGEAPAAKVIQTRVGTVHSILIDQVTERSDAELMERVAKFYHDTFCNDARAMSYLQKRKCFHPEAVKTFQIGFANRTLGYRVPKNTTEGRELKERLTRLGIFRNPKGEQGQGGHEHLNGSVVVPLSDEGGRVVQMYGRKVCGRLREGTPLHLYLEGELRGIFNREGMRHQTEWILCESILDALTFWCAGFRNVTCTFGTNNFTSELWELVRQEKPRRIILAFDADEAGNRAAAQFAPKLAELGVTVFRARLPIGSDINEVACQSANATAMLAGLIETAEEIAASNLAAEPLVDLRPEPITADPVPPAPQEKADEHRFEFGERRWRMRGLGKNLSYDNLKVNLQIAFGNNGSTRFHQDTLDLCNAKHRDWFIERAQKETGLSSELLRHDLGQVFLKSEELQENLIRQTLAPKTPVVPPISEEEREEALGLLRDPDLSNRLIEDFAACGVVGESHNVQLGYLAAVSRKFEKPLSVIIQSTSAAGKTTLMEAILAFMPEEERIKYSAMTGQALFYLGETDLQHKILAVAEEEGAERATYAMKLLASEGELTIASTGKDAATGRLVTEQYHVKGPAMILFTTTSIEIDEELANRCLILTVDESREQTRRIHEMQREAETIEGHLAGRKRQQILRVHRNAQRLLRPLPVHNPYARLLTFPDENTRMRRDQRKYLTLIRAIALLHQYQRPLRVMEGIEHVEVTLDDIALANRLVGAVLGHSLDDMPPQTRRFLEALWQMVRQVISAKEIEQRSYRFSQRDVRETTGYSQMQIKRHLVKLVDLEYVLVHRGTRGQSFVYELVYHGEGRDGERFMMGLLNVNELLGKQLVFTYDDNRGNKKEGWGMAGAPQGQRWGNSGAMAPIDREPSNEAGSEPHHMKNTVQQHVPGNSILAS